MRAGVHPRGRPRGGASPARAVPPGRLGRSPPRAHHRVGTLARRYGRIEEAAEAVRKCVDPAVREVEAAPSPAEMYWNARRFGEAGPLLGMTMERLRDGDAPAELREAMLRSTLEMLRAGLDMDPTPIALTAVWERGTTGGNPVVGLSSVDLRELSDPAWARL